MNETSLTEPEDVYYTPRLEVTNGKQVAHAWQDWGSFDEPSKAYAVAKCLLNDVKDLKFTELLTPEEKKAGYFINVAIETVVNGSLVAIEDFKPLRSPKAAQNSLKECNYC